MRIRTIDSALKLFASALCLTAMSCSVDDAYDLSKDIDMTVGVGNGLSIPVGSTDTIRLTEMIDPAKSDVVNVTDDGSYVIEKNGTFDAVDFEIDEVDGLRIDTHIEEQRYSMDLKELYSSRDEAIEAIKNQNLPQNIVEKLIAELKAQKIAVSLDEHIDKNDVKFDFHKKNLPKELNRIYRVEFEEPVRMHLEIDVLCDTDPAMFELMDSLELSTAGDEDEHFFVRVPEYLEFVEGTRINGDKLYLEGAVYVNEDRNQFVMDWDFYIKALNFKDGYEIKNGSLDFDDKLEINGLVKSNIVTVEASDVIGGYRTFNDVAFVPVIKIDDFDIQQIEAQVDVEIGDVEESIDIDLGDDLDFLYEDGTVLDFANPQLVVNVNNNSAVSVASEVVIRGYDENGNYIEGSEALAYFDIQAASANRFLVTNNGENMEGCVAVKSDLSNLFKKLPHTIGFEMKSKNNTEERVDISLGNKMDVSGDYEVIIPLEFNEVALTYTETIENVLGDDPTEVTDYIKDLELVTIDIEIANTVPADFTPAVVAYDANGKQLKNIVATVEGKVKAGEGIKNGELTAPVKSAFRILLSANNGELGELDTLDLELNGVGSGKLNSNEYIKIEKMTLNIEKPIEVDLN